MENSELIYIKDSIEKIGDYNSDSFPKDIKDLIDDFFKKVINNSSDHYRKIIMSNMDLINSLINSFDKQNINKNEEIKKLKEFIFVLILDKYIKAYNSKADYPTKQDRYTKKDGYNDINENDKHWDNLLILAQNFGIKSEEELKEFCKNKQKDKENLKNLLMEFGFGKDIIYNFIENDIAPNNIDLFYKELLQLKENKDLEGGNRKNYIIYYIDINNLNSEYYIEDKNLRNYFLSKLNVFICKNPGYDFQNIQQLIKNFKELSNGIYEANLPDIIFEISIPFSKHYIKNIEEGQNSIKIYKNNIDYINTLPNNIDLRIFFIQELRKLNGKDGKEIEQFKQKFKKNNELIFIELTNKSSANLESYMLSLIKYLNNKQYETQQVEKIINNIKEIQGFLTSKENFKDFANYIIEICDSNSEYYIENATDKKNVMTEFLNRKAINGLKNDQEVKSLILLQKGLMVFDDNIDGYETKILNDGIKCVDVKDLTIQMLSQDSEKYDEIIKNLKNGNYKIIPNNEGGASSNKFKIINEEGRPVYYFKFFDSLKEKTDIGSVPNEQKQLGIITELINNTEIDKNKLNEYFSTCDMNTIECKGNKRLNMIITETAKSPVFVDGKFTVDKTNGNVKINDKHNKNDKSIEDILIEFSKDKTNLDEYMDKQINFVKSLYSYFAIMSIFDIHDMRPFGNIAVDMDTGKIQAFDFDLEKGVAFGINLNENRTKEKECIQKINLEKESFLKNKPIAVEFAELSKDLYIWQNKDVIANMVLSIHEIITGQSAIENEKVKFSIPDTINKLNTEIEKLKTNEIENQERINKLNSYKEQLIELENYKTYTANIMVNLAESIDNEIEKLLEKEKLEEKEEEKLSFLIERRANVIAVFKETEIGKEANKLYTQKHNCDIEWRSQDIDTELSAIQSGISIDEKRSLNRQQFEILSTDNQLLNEKRKEIVKQSNEILKLKNQSRQANIN